MSITPDLKNHALAGAEVVTVPILLRLTGSVVREIGRRIAVVTGRDVLDLIPPRINALWRNVTPTIIWANNFFSRGNQAIREIIVAPILEEIVFRGPLVLLNLSGGSLGARCTLIVTTSLLFALSHPNLNPGPALELTVAGVAYSVLTDRRGLLASIAAHSTNNIINNIIRRVYNYFFP